MITIEALNRLSTTQMAKLHEGVGSFMTDNIKEIESANLEELGYIQEYLSEIENLKNQLVYKRVSSELNEMLYKIFDTIVKIKKDEPYYELCTNIKKDIIMQYQRMKNLDFCQNLINDLDGSKVQVDEFVNISNVDATISCENDIIQIDYTMPTTNLNYELTQNLEEIHITLNGKKYYARTGDFFLEYNKDLCEEGILCGKLRINRLYGHDFSLKESAYFRYMIPIDIVDWTSDIITGAAILKNSFSPGLIELIDKDTIIHVYPCEFNKRKFMVVESLTETTREKMQEYVYSVSLTIGIITGNIHLGKCYAFSSTTSGYVEQVVLAYETMRTSSNSNMKIFTTNMYYIREILKNNKVKQINKIPLYNENDEFQAHLQDWLQPEMIQSLFSLIQNDANIARAVVTLIESDNFPLEYQASVRAIVIETIAHTKVVAPIPNKLWRKIADDMNNVIDKYTIDQSNEEEAITPEISSLLKKKINNMNSPTNADALAQPFNDVGYILTENDRAAIKERNRFLHGRLFDGTAEEQADKLFYISLMLHKLSYIIILKLAGFNGYILNNPLLYNCKDAVKAGEHVLIKI